MRPGTQQRDVNQHNHLSDTTALTVTQAFCCGWVEIAAVLAAAGSLVSPTACNALRTLASPSAEQTKLSVQLTYRLHACLLTSLHTGLTTEVPSRAVDAEGRVGGWGGYKRRPAAQGI